jgi:uncharacterized membrane protein
MTLLPVHVFGGLVAIAAGFVALFTLKGARRHRTSGLLFVYAMTTMALTGVVISVSTPKGWSTALGGFLAFYMAMTGLLAGRRREPGPRKIDRWVLLGAVALGVTYYAFGFEALQSATGKKDGYPAPMFFVFGTVTWLSAFGDARVALRGIEGARRIARHVSRMSLAMFIATASFFLGQAKVIPKPIRIMPLLSIPVLVVVVMMVYWLVRLRMAKPPRVILESARKPAVREIPLQVGNLQHSPRLAP